MTDWAERVVNEEIESKLAVVQKRSGQLLPFAPFNQIHHATPRALFSLPIGG